MSAPLVPPTATYEGVRSSGEPLCRGFFGRPESAVIADFAWHEYLIQSPTPLDDEGQNGRKDLLAALVAANPALKLIALVGGGLWPIQYPDAASYYGEMRISLDRVNGFVPYDPNVVDMSNPMATAACLKVWKKRVLRPPWQGVFIDGFGGVPPDPGRFAEVGFGTHQQYRKAWRKGWLGLAEQMRSAAPTFWLCGNGGRADPAMGQYFSGWMNENWPHQPGCGFAEMEQARHWFKGPMVIFTATDLVLGGHSSPGNMLKVNYGQACAALFGAIHIYLPADATSTHDQLWWTWKPERWALGKPLSHAYREGAIWRRQFHNGAVWAEPSWFYFTGRGGMSTVRDFNPYDP